MYVQRFGADVKLYRARQTLGQLEAMQEEYLGSGAIRFESTPAPDGKDRWLIRIEKELPTEFALLVGNALHAARSALDELAVALVVAGGRTPRGARFPIARSAHHFDEELSSCLRRADPQARGAVRAVKPWKGADDKLWELHLLAPGERRLPVIHLGQNVPLAPVRVPSVLRVLQGTTSGTGTRYPLRDNSVVSIDESASAETDPAALLRSTLRIVIGEGELVRGQPVTESLDMLIAHTAEVVDEVCAAAETRL